MNYLNIERTTNSYEDAISQCKLIQLEHDTKLGDIFGKYILTSNVNPLLIKDGEKFTYDGYFKKGMYVNLIPLQYIHTMVSDTKELNIEGFTVYTDRAVFHTLKGFDKNMNEILDLDKSKEKVVIRYYYINEQIK